MDRAQGAEKDQEKRFRFGLFHHGRRVGGHGRFSGAIYGQCRGRFFGRLEQVLAGDEHANLLPATSRPGDVGLEFGRAAPRVRGARAAVGVPDDRRFSFGTGPAGQRVAQTCGLARDRIRAFNNRRAVPPNRAPVVFGRTEAAFAAGRTAVRSVLSARGLVTMEVVMGTSGVG